MSLSRRCLVSEHLAERGELIETLRQVGPTAPSLCAPWSAAQIASHLVASEQHAGIWWAAGWPVRRLIGPAATAAVLRRGQPLFDAAMKRCEARGWDWLLEHLGKGPPRLFRTRALTQIRLLEDWIHHEDVRRANDLGSRDLSPARERALIDGVRALSRIPEFAAARRHARVELTDGTVIAGDEGSQVTIVGPIGEVLLALAGRFASSDVQVEGDADLLNDGRFAF